MYATPVLPCQLEGLAERMPSLAAASPKRTSLLPGMRIGRRLSIAFMITAMLAGAGVGLTNYLIAREALLAETRERLLALALSRRAAIVGFLRSMESDVRSMSQNPWLKGVLLEFSFAWRRLDGAQAHLSRHYRSDAPDNRDGRLDDAGDSSPYSDVHSRSHSHLADFVDDRGYADLFLVDSDGNVVYSTQKNTDFAVNLVVGPLAESSLGQAFRDVTRQRRAGRIQLIDFRPYEADGGRPAAFLAAPIMEGRRSFLGALILRLPIDRFSAVTNVAAGLGSRGDVVLIGQDGLLRSNSRLSEDPTVLAVRLSDPAILRGLTGETGVDTVMRQDLATGLDERALAAYVPVAFGWNAWVVVASRPMDEILAPIHRMGLLSLYGGAGILGLILLASIGVARGITSPIANITSVMLRLARGETSAQVPHLERTDEIGEMAGALEVFKQNSERIARLREQVEQERRLLALTFNTMEQGIALFDIEKTIRVFNQRFVALLNLDADLVSVGADRNTLLAAQLPQTIPHRRKADRVIPLLSIGTDLFDVDLIDQTEQIRRSTAGRYVAIQTVPLDDGGHVQVYSDFSQRIRQEYALQAAKEDAEQAARAKAAFLATMSHEIRTPMNGVMSMATLLSQSDLSDDQEGMVTVIRQSASALLTIINDILDFSKIEAGRLTIEEIEMSLAETVESVGDLLALRAEEKTLEFLIDLDPLLPDRILGDPTRLRQVLFNLAGNAIKFTESGRVSIQVREAYAEDRTSNPAALADRLRFQVMDTGIGLTAEQCNRLFKPFTQADESTARKYGGTGLGLSICHGLCELMGGRIGVTSSPGRGSTFWFELPFRPAGATAAAQPETDITDATVLLLGHSAETAAVLQRYLAPGFAGRCVVAPDVERAMAQTRDNGDGMPQTFDVILVDAHCVDSSLERLKMTLDNGGHPPRFVLTSARSLASSMMEATRIGFMAILTYPVRRNRLWRVIAAAMGRVSLDRQSRVTGHLTVTYRPPPIEEARIAGALVLVAEDNHTNQVVLQRVLNRLGYAHEFADNGREALEKYDAGTYGLLLTDFHMPEMDGFELTRAVRSREARNGGDRLPIIALTADALPGTQDRCLQAGMDGYLSKPIDIDALTEVLETWLPKAQTLRVPADPTGTQQPVANTATAGESGQATPLSIDPDIFDPARLTETFGAFDHDARAFLADFLHRAEALVDEISANLTTGDVMRAKKAAHAIKGSARSVGAERLGRLGGDLQTAIEHDDHDTAEVVAELLPMTLEELQAAVAPLVATT